jgi:hypothetical protein
MITAGDNPWGFLSHPVHQQALVEGAPWRDNAFLAFWDPEQDVFGVVHCSTSPNAEGRRARCSIVQRGRSVEVVDPLAPGSFQSESLDFDLEAGVITVDDPQLSVRLTMTPRFVMADYSPTGLIPDLVEGASLRHYQQGANVSGEISLGTGPPVTIDGHGLRDRTWGPRDESQAFSEYLGVVACLPRYDLTVMKFRGADGTARTHGFLLHADRALPVHRLDVNRDAAGLIDGARLFTEDGDEIGLRLRRARGGFWVPMGSGGPPPVMSAYDDAADVDSDDGQAGGGFSEQGVVRHLGAHHRKAL